LLPPNPKLLIAAAPRPSQTHVSAVAITRNGHPPARERSRRAGDAGRISAAIAAISLERAACRRGDQVGRRLDFSEPIGRSSTPANASRMLRQPTASPTAGPGRVALDEREISFRRISLERTPPAIARNLAAIDSGREPLRRPSLARRRPRIHAP